MQAVVLVFRAQLWRRWPSWLALAALVGVAGGVVLAAIAAGDRTATAFPQFVAAHGYDDVVVSNTPVPQLARLPEVASAAEARIAINGQPTCGCTHPIDPNDLNVMQLPPRALERTVNLVAGRMPDQSAPDEVLASFNLQQDDGVRIGMVIHVPFYAASQRQSVLNATGTGPSPAGPTVPLRVVGIEAAETEFPQGSTSPAYDLYTTEAFARSVLPKTTTVLLYFVTLRHGTADGPRFKADTRSLGIQNLQNEDTPALLVEGSIHPQAIGWWALAALAVLAGLAVVGQAVSRQRAAESEKFPALSALGLTRGQFAVAGMAATFVIAVVGAAGAVGIAYALSPLAPVGEARFAESSAGFAFDAVVLGWGAVGTVIVVLLLGIWPSVRAARKHHAGGARQSRPAAIARLLAAANGPPTAVIGVRHALERRTGRDGIPVSTALLGTILALAALCGTAVFGSSLSHLTASPALYGDDYQLVIYGAGYSSQILADVEHSPAIAAVTLGTGAQLVINKTHVTVFAATAVRGPLLLSTVTGRFPRGTDQIALGSSTLRAAGGHIGSLVRATVLNPAGGASRAVSFQVVGTVSLPTGIAADQTGLGVGGAMTIDAYLHGLCRPGVTQPTCLGNARHTLNYAAFVRGVPGPRGQAAIAHFANEFGAYASRPAPPTGLVNFGEAVNFPLIFGVILALFGASALAHMLVVSVGRRRHEMSLLKALGLVKRQIAAIVFWQATTVILVGVVIGVPLGVAIGRALWHSFALNIGVVPVPVVDGSLISSLAACALAVAVLLAVTPAIVASRRQPARLLRTE